MPWTHFLVVRDGVTACGLPSEASTPEHPFIVSDSPLNVSCPLCLRVLAFELEEAL